MEIQYTPYEPNRLAQEYRRLELEIEIYRKAIRKLKEKKGDLIRQRKKTRQRMLQLGARI